VFMGGLGGTHACLSCDGDGRGRRDGGNGSVQRV